MIFDNIKNAEIYMAVSPGLAKAFQFLKDPCLASLKPGRVEIDGNLAYAMVHDYTTKPVMEAKWEAHKKYIDVQTLLSGKEQIGVAYTPDMREAEVYDEAHDLQFLTGQGRYLDLASGFFIVLGPDDAHQPGLAYDQAEPVRKLVIKVAVNA